MPTPLDYRLACDGCSHRGPSTPTGAAYCRTCQDVGACWTPTPESLDRARREWSAEDVVVARGAR